MDAARNQHAQAVAQAVQQAEEAQKTGTGPKPMMVTPYKHNWIIAGASQADPAEEDKYVHPSFPYHFTSRMFDWDGIVSDLTSLWKERKITPPTGCCTMTPPSTDMCRMM
jgi:hypothetical protein